MDQGLGLANFNHFPLPVQKSNKPSNLLKSGRPSFSIGKRPREPTPAPQQQKKKKKSHQPEVADDPTKVTHSGSERRSKGRDDRPSRSLEVGSQPNPVTDLAIVEVEEKLPLETLPAREDSPPALEFARHEPSTKGKEKQKPDKDPLAGFNQFILEKMPEATKEKARASGGKFHPNIVRTFRFPSGSGSSCPSNPKSVVFPVPMSDDEHSDDDYLDEEDSIPGGRKFSADERRKMIREMVKCAPEDYASSLKGSSEAYVGPMMSAMADVRARS